MKNIAILFDVENLVGGYNLKYLSEISLKNILLKIKEKEIGSIAIQKAYADWSNSNLSSLKWDIAELGIEPIQMYGFSKGSMKNASDIQLVIDAMEILHTKPFIDTFVIVSGDGGFSSLVKKISEYGKKVIGCAYKNTANIVFTKVCDEFIYIDDTLNKEQLEKLQTAQLEESKKMQILQNPILKEILPKFERLDNYTLKDMEKIVKRLLEELKKNTISKDVLNTKGLNISVLKGAFNYLFIEFNHSKFGFTKLQDFLRFMLKDSGLKLVLKEPSDYRVVFESVKLNGFKDVPFMQETPSIHSKENYINILKKGSPIIIPPLNKENFVKIIEYFLENREEFLNIPFSEIVEELKVLGIEETEIIKNLYILINGNSLKGDNPMLSLKEQNYYFSPLTKEELYDSLFGIMKEKIISFIDGTIDNNEFKKVIMDFKDI